MAKKSVEAFKPDEEWRAESDLHTLMEAEKIKADPKRMAKVRALAKKKMMEAAAIASEGQDKS
jgi:hypothetical protein